MFDVLKKRCGKCAHAKILVYHTKNADGDYNVVHMCAASAEGVLVDEYDVCGYYKKANPLQNRMKLIGFTYEEAFKAMGLGSLME